MSNGYKKRRKEIAAVVDDLPGFVLSKMEVSNGDHLCCHITDDVGNTFKAWTGQSCSSNTRRARLNFRHDIRLISNRLKGLCE